MKKKLLTGVDQEGFIFLCGVRVRMSRNIDQTLEEGFKDKYWEFMRCGAQPSSFVKEAFLREIGIYEEVE